MCVWYSIQISQYCIFIDVCYLEDFWRANLLWPWQALPTPCLDRQACMYMWRPVLAIVVLTHISHGFPLTLFLTSHSIITSISLLYIYTYRIDIILWKRWRMECFWQTPGNFHLAFGILGIWGTFSGWVGMFHGRHGGGRGRPSLYLAIANLGTGTGKRHFWGWGWHLGHVPSLPSLGSMYEMSSPRADFGQPVCDLDQWLAGGSWHYWWLGIPNGCLSDIQASPWMTVWDDFCQAWLWKAVACCDLSLCLE